ncbi:MAG TPA: hypothetical protein VJJ23_03835 [Candidatus Nanoarchaeia archaeon]|nr:hypothetical protein [Candidatus Nanoarchaeia archaeon]
MGNNKRRLTRSALLAALSLAVASPTMAYAKQKTIPSIPSQTQRLQQVEKDLRGFGYNDHVEPVENIDTTQAKPDTLDDKVNHDFDIGKVFSAIGSGAVDIFDYWGNKINKPRLVNKNKIDNSKRNYDVPVPVDKQARLVEEKDLVQGFDAVTLMNGSIPRVRIPDNTIVINNKRVLPEGYNAITKEGSLLTASFEYDRERNEDIVHVSVPEKPLVESVRSQFSKEAQMLASAMIKDDKHEIDRKMQTDIIEVPQRTSFSDINDLYSDNEVVDEFKPSQLDSLLQDAEIKEVKTENLTDNVVPKGYDPISDSGSVLFLERRISQEPIRVIDNLLASNNMLRNRTTFSESKEDKEFVYAVNPERASEIFDDYQRSQDSLRAIIKDWVASSLDNPENRTYLPQGIEIENITFKEVTPVTSTVNNPFDLDDLLKTPKAPFLNDLKNKIDTKSSKESFASNIPKKENIYTTKIDSDTTFIYVKTSEENPKQDTISEAIRNHRIGEKLRVNNDILYGKNGDVKRVLGLNGIENDRKVKAGKYIYSIDEKVVDQPIASGNGCVGSNNLETITGKSDSEVHNATVPVIVSPAKNEYATVNEPKHRRKRERGLQKLKFKGKDNEDSKFRKFDIDKAEFLFGENSKLYEFVTRSYETHKSEYHYGSRSTLRHVRYDFRRETKKLEDARGIKTPVAMNISDTTIYKILKAYTKSEIV